MSRSRLQKVRQIDGEKKNEERKGKKNCERERKMVNKIPLPTLRSCDKAENFSLILIQSFSHKSEIKKKQKTKQQQHYFLFALFCFVFHDNTVLVTTL